MNVMDMFADANGGEVIHCALRRSILGASFAFLKRFCVSQLYKLIFTQQLFKRVRNILLFLCLSLVEHFHVSTTVDSVANSGMIQRLLSFHSITLTNDSGFKGDEEFWAPNPM